MDVYIVPTTKIKQVHADVSKEEDPKKFIQKREKQMELIAH